MKRSIILFALCSFLCLPPVFSRVFCEETSGEKAWTLEECIQIALKNRPELEVSKSDITQAEFQIKEAQSYYYPRLNLTGGYTRFNNDTIVSTDIDVSALTGQIREPIYNTYGIRLPLVIHEDLAIGKRDWLAAILNLDQPIYTFGRIDEAVKQARIGHSVAVQQKEKKRSEITLDVKKAYYQFLGTREAVQILKEAEAKADVVSKMVKIAYETATPGKEEKGATRLDYLKAENFRSELKAKLSEMNKNAQLAELALKVAMGLDANAPLRVIAPSLEGFPLETWALEELKELTFARNIDLKTLDLGVQFFDSKRKSAKKEYFPKIGIHAEYIGPEDRYSNKNVLYGGIGLTMPLFDGFQTKAKVGQSEAQFQKMKGQKVVAEKALSAQVEYLTTTLKELQERIRILQPAIREVRERMSLASDAYAAGIIEYNELLLAERAELEGKSIYLQALLNYQMTKSELEYISGMQ